MKKKREEIMRWIERRRRRSTIAWLIVGLSLIGIIAGIATLIVSHKRTQDFFAQRIRTTVPSGGHHRARTPVDDDYDYEALV